MAQIQSYENWCITEGEWVGGRKTSWEEIVWNQKIIENSRHPLKVGYRVQSGSQGEKIEEKKIKLFTLQCPGWEKGVVMLSIRVPCVSIPFRQNHKEIKFFMSLNIQPRELQETCDHGKCTQGFIRESSTCQPAHPPVRAILEYQGVATPEC